MLSAFYLSACFWNASSFSFLVFGCDSCDSCSLFLAFIKESAFFPHEGREREREKEKASRAEGVGNSHYRLSKNPWEHKEALGSEITSGSYQEWDQRSVKTPR